MDTKPISKSCPKCQTPLPADAPHGLCPKCLLAAVATPTEAGQSAGRPAPPPVEEIAAAFPQLEILEFIGQGGMGFVFKARQPKLDRLVALKILPQSLAADPTFAERFNREARLLARLNHPGIVTVHDFGVASHDLSTPDSQPFYYLLMEFVDGVNLRQAMQAGRFTPEQALAIVPKICEALQFAHNEGILHRDIKPENILLDAKGRVKIADFGIAKLVAAVCDRREGEGDNSRRSQTVATENLTEAGKTLGSPNYMAPEQIDHPGEVDHRADIYSLGVVFYEMLTGELPRGRFAPPSEKSTADPRVDEVVLRALEKEKSRRHASADEVRTQVETIAAMPDSGRRRGDESHTEKQSASKDQSQSLLTSSPTDVETRFSRIAIVGACWAGFFLLTIATFVSLKLVGDTRTTRMILMISGGLFSLLGLTAPLGATILGWVAVAQIRRSARKLHGMWLAVFDGLLFPLLALNFLVGWMVLVALLAVASLFQFKGSPSTVLVILLLLLIVIPLNRYIIRRVWRAVNRRVGSPAPPVQKPDRFWRWFALAVFAMIAIPFLISIIGLLAAIAIPNFVKARSSAQTQHQNQAQTQRRDDESLAKVRADKTHLTITDTNEIAVIQFTDAPLVTVIENLARNLHLNYVIEPKLFGELEASPLVFIHWEKLTARQALTAILDSRDLQLVENPQTGVARIVRKTADASTQRTNVIPAVAQNLSFGPVMPASALQFRLVVPKDSTEPTDELPGISGPERFHVLRETLLDGSAVAQAGVDFNPDGTRRIEIQFTSAGKQKFAEITATNLNHQLAVVFGGKVLSAPFIRATISGGQCSIVGNLSREEVYALLDCLNRNTTASDQTMKFTAPREQILPFQPSPGFLVGWLDLDSGKVLTNSILDWQTHAGHEWIRSNSLDLATTDSSKEIPVLLGFDAIILAAPTNGWDTVTAVDVAYQWNLLQDEPQQMKMIGAIPNQSAMYFFRTREDGRGLLQIIGFTENPRGVKIRYKLVQQANATQ